MGYSLKTGNSNFKQSYFYKTIPKQFHDKPIFYSSVKIRAGNPHPNPNPKSESDPIFVLNYNSNPQFKLWIRIVVF